MCVLGGTIGDCVTDQFAISGNPGSPVICGTNTGQHMIIDASEDCHMAAFNIGATTSTNREWNIVVSQYICPDGISTSAGELYPEPNKSHKTSHYTVLPSLKGHLDAFSITQDQQELLPASTSL